MVGFSEIFIDSTKFVRKIKKSDYLDSGIYPIIDQGQEFVIGYTNDEKGLYNDVPAIIFGDHTRIIKYIDKPFFIGADGVKVLKTKIDDVDYKYLYYALRNIDIINTGYNRHFKWLKESKIKLPDIKKQQEIATILDSIENIVNLKNMQLQEYDQLIKSRFVGMFESFEKTDLSNIAEIIMGQSPDSAYYNENGVGLPFFQGKADFGAKYTNVSYWTTKPSKTAKKGNVLMSVRAPVGPVNISSVDCCIGRGLCSINAIPNKTNNEFLHNALIAIQDQITAMGTGSTFKAINKSDVYAIQLPLAPISLQNEFANFVEQVDKLKFEVQKSLNETQMLFDSLMQEYFG